MKYRKLGSVKITNICSLCIVITLSAFFGLYNFINSGMYSTDQMAVFTITYSVVLLVITSSHRNDYRTHKLHSFVIPNGLFILMILTSIVVVRLRINQPWYYTIKESTYYIASLLVFLLCNEIYRNKTSLDKLKTLIVKSAIICAVISIIEYIGLMNQVDLLRLNTYIQERNGGARFEIGTMAIVLSILVSISVLITNNESKRNKKLYIINLLLQLINLLLIIQTRSLILYLTITVVIALLANRQFGLKTKVFLYAALIASIALLIASNFFSSFVSIFHNDIGVVHRYYTIDFYMNQFREHPITGMGFVSGNKTLSTASLLLGSNMNHNRSDVGIVGLLNEFGVIGLIWLLVFLGTVYRRLKTIKGRVMEEHYLFIFLFFVYIIITCINLILTDTFRFMYMPLLMLFCEKSDLYSLKTRI